MAKEITDKQQLKLSQDVALAIEQINEAVEALEPEHIQTIKKAINGIRADMSRYNAIGIMFEPETSEAREILAKQALSRLNCILEWRAGLDMVIEGQTKAIRSKIEHEIFKKNIGL